MSKKRKNEVKSPKQELDLEKEIQQIDQDILLLDIQIPTPITEQQKILQHQDRYQQSQEFLNTMLPPIQQQNPKKSKKTKVFQKQIDHQKYSQNVFNFYKSKTPPNLITSFYEKYQNQNDKNNKNNDSNLKIQDEQIEDITPNKNINNDLIKDKQNNHQSFDIKSAQDLNDYNDTPEQKSLGNLMLLDNIQIKQINPIEKQKLQQQFSKQNLKDNFLNINIQDIQQKIPNNQIVEQQLNQNKLKLIQQQFITPQKKNNQSSQSAYSSSFKQISLMLNNLNTYSEQKLSSQTKTIELNEIINQQIMSQFSKSLEFEPSQINNNFNKSIQQQSENENENTLPENNSITLKKESSINNNSINLSNYSDSENSFNKSLESQFSLQDTDQQDLQNQQELKNILKNYGKNLQDQNYIPQEQQRVNNNQKNKQSSINIHALHYSLLNDLQYYINKNINRIKVRSMKSLLIQDKQFLALKKTDVNPLKLPKYHHPLLSPLKHEIYVKSQKNLALYFENTNWKKSTRCVPDRQMFWNILNTLDPEYTLNVVKYVKRDLEIRKQQRINSKLTVQQEFLNFYKDNQYFDFENFHYRNKKKPKSNIVFGY